MEDVDWIAQHFSRLYFWPGSTPEDVLQEARYAILRAEPAYDPRKGSWPRFAWVAAYRWLLTLIQREAERRPQFASDEPLRYRSSRESRSTTDELLDIRANARRLSELERRTLAGVVEGYSYDEIGFGHKRIDNAVSRARRKLAA